jgi:hypothetical protein
MSSRRTHKRMYAVSKDGVGLIAGTLAYSRKAAIGHFVSSTQIVGPHAWEMFKQTGYRTVMARVEVVLRPNRLQ